MSERTLGALELEAAVLRGAWSPRLLPGGRERPWSVREAADWLGKTPEYVRREAAAGRLPVLGRVGRELRFDPADVRALLRPVVPRDSARAIVARTRGRA